MDECLSSIMSTDTHLVGREHTFDQRQNMGRETFRGQMSKHLTNGNGAEAPRLLVRSEEGSSTEVGDNGGRA